MTRNIALSMLTLIAFAALILPAAIRAGEPASESFYAPQKVVFHNNGRGDDSAKYFKGLLRNITNNIEAVGSDRIENGLARQYRQRRRTHTNNQTSQRSACPWLIPTS